MEVEVRLFANFRESVGKKRVMVSVGSVEELFDYFNSNYPDLAKEILKDQKSKRVKDFVNILVNGRDIRDLKGIETRLKDGDAVSIFPPVSGGLN